MSKAIKKITKSVSKVAKSVYKHTLGDDGPLDGSMDILGLTVREEQQKQAERRAERRARILKEIPKSGSLDITKVKDSVYFFI